MSAPALRDPEPIAPGKGPVYGSTPPMDTPTETTAAASTEGESRQLRRDFSVFSRAFGRRYFEPIPLPEEGTKTFSELAAKGEIVHVMRRVSAISFLYLAWWLLRRALPPLRAAIGMGWSYWSPFRRLFRRGSSAEQLTRALDSQASALVFLRNRRGAIPELPPERDPFFALVARARREQRPLFLVPELYWWGHRARNVRPTLRDLIFGSPEAPGPLAAAIGFLLNYKTAFFRVGAPVDLTAFVRDNAADSDQTLVRKVRGALYQHLARETRAIVGPPRKSRERIIEETLRDRTLRAALEHVAAEKGLPVETLRAEAEKNLNKISADYSAIVLTVFKRILTWFFYRVHTGVEVDEKGFERTMAAAREAPIILCPSHKSHLDYLLLSWHLAERGVAIPLIAAGANLSFWPAGPLLRRSGAFFLRRSFKGDKVYAASFKAYVKKLMREGYTQEFFIEGGRSRTGKLLAPKLGVLSFEVDAFLEGAQDDVYFVPVAIDYEKVVEAKSYAKELAGGEKKAESIKSLLEAPKAFTGRYGRIYLSFEEPISLRKFLLDRLGSLDKAADEQVRRAAIRSLAQKVTFGISRAAVITPAALVSAALLAHRRRGIGAREAGAHIHALRELALKKGARLSPVLEGAPSDPSVLGPINEALKLFVEDELIQQQVIDGETIYQVPDDRRPSLSFYKNNLVHLTVARSLIATALLGLGGETTLEELREQVLFLSLLFKLEFSFGKSLDAQLSETLDALSDEGMVVRKEGKVAVAPEPHARNSLMFLRDLTRDFLESYRIFASVLPVAASPVDRKELLRRALDRGRADFLSGQVGCSEALSKPNLENALALFVDRRVLLESEDGKKVSISPEDRGAPERYLAQIDRLLATEPR